VIRARSRGLAFTRKFVGSILDVYFMDARSHKTVAACSFSREDLGTRFKGHDLTIEYPPASDLEKLPIKESSASGTVH